MAAALVPLFWNFRGTRRNAEQLTQSSPTAATVKTFHIHRSGRATA